MKKPLRIFLIIFYIVLILIILGISLIKISCSPITISEQVNPAIKNQIKVLFGADKYGVNCMGEGSQEIKLETGQRGKIFCMIKVNKTTDYELNIKEISSLRGSDSQEVNSWIVDSGWNGTVLPSEDGKEVPVLLLNIPNNVPSTTIKITIEEVKNNSTKTHQSIIDIIHASLYQKIFQSFC